MKTLLNSLNRM